MEEKIKVAMVAVDLSRTGISAVIMNYCRYINKRKFEISLLVGNHILNNYREECKKMGINIIELPFKLENSVSYYKELTKKLNEKRYDIVHVHGNSSMITPELILAKICGIKVRIAHSHNTTCNHKILNKILKPLFKIGYTDGFACGRLAGKWMFGQKPFCVIPNGFDVNKFAFDSEARNQIRSELEIEDKYVVGHIGQFNDQKNHRFLFEIFDKLAQINDDIVLLLIGNGPDYLQICKLIEKHRYKDRIIVYGETNSPEKMYSAMDCFVFPSKYEGLPVSLLEAQISGLPCIASDKITKEVDFGQIIWKSIEEKSNEWAKKILKFDIGIEKRIQYISKHEKEVSKYNITEDVKILEKKYREMIQDRI